MGDKPDPLPATLSSLEEWQMKVLNHKHIVSILWMKRLRIKIIKLFLQDHTGDYYKEWNEFEREMLFYQMTFMVEFRSLLRPKTVTVLGKSAVGHPMKWHVRHGMTCRLYCKWKGWLLCVLSQDWHELKPLWGITPVLHAEPFKILYETKWKWQKNKISSWGSDWKW